MGSGYNTLTEALYPIVMGLTEIIGHCPTKKMDYVVNFKYDTIKLEIFDETVYQKVESTFSCEYVERGNPCEYFMEDCPLYIKYNSLVNGKDADD